MLKEIDLVSYPITVKKLIKPFSSIRIEHLSHKKHADPLATLATKIYVPDKTVAVRTMRTMLQANATNLNLVHLFEEQD